MERELRNKELKDFHEWLQAHVDGYVALCEAGSTTAGDPWVEGRTDRDITIVVEELTDDIQTAIRKYLKGKFGDSYLFIIFDRETFLSNTTEQDLSIKFRGLTLFGEDVIVQKPEPAREFAAELAQKGLKSQERKLRTRLMNAGHWSVERLRNYMYPEFKRLIMWLAAKKYAESGEYPRARTDVALAHNSKEVEEIVLTIQNIDSTSRENLTAVTELAITVARENIDEA